MGGTAGDEAPAFRAEVAPFYVGKSLVTNEQYEAFDPSHRRGESSPGDDTPAVGVSFRDAVAYCDWYSRISGKAFRLPTEVEWEWACRGESPAARWWGDDAAAADRFAWHAGNSGGRCREIETLRANPHGLHDTLGLAWEWASSLHRPYPVVAGDGREDLGVEGPRVLRGGSFRTAASELSGTRRRAAAEGERFDDAGFRIVRAL